ncbi:unnamed protein product (macronuclear) [Paramecium tetraurelia]|uniref:Uncharacterized protein n=1 Tax=Paramecium tetraurelia TaxID=5888 RepID=A0DT91_PARTE|nr:uncharacterized protein GSPATT00019951001 [Paramecium tetraurelia]CAK86258.1 unnamed protein product [Paramecium tetraurelia]|eukprot:XP_001453655.1 hypothetical protein (macronuclear) [Paramecium tetraurelia strain d4-2]
MQGARFVETNLVQKMLRNQNYDFHKKKLDEIQTDKKGRFAFKDLPVLSKTQQIKAQSSRFQKSEQRKRIDEQNQYLSSHIIEIQEGKNSQFRSIWTVQNLREKAYADTSQWCENALGKRLHSPLRRKQQQKIDEENQELQKRLELTKQILLEKQQEQISKYEKLRDHMTRIKSKGPNSPMMNTHFPSVKSKSTTHLINKPFQSDSLIQNSKMNDLLKSEINISKISKIE